MSNASNTSPQSPRAKARKSLRKAYRTRGHRNENLWLVYSPKTDKDWLITSDRILVHWLAHLEADPAVVSFELATEDSPNSNIETSAADSIAVYRDGRKILNHLSNETTQRKENASLSSGSELPFTAAMEEKRDISHYELQEQAPLAMRWLKCISFAAVIRGQQHLPTQNALAAQVHMLREGTVRQLLDGLVHHDEPVVLGLLVRMAVSGQVVLNLNAKTFGYTTEWCTARD